MKMISIEVTSYEYCVKIVVFEPATSTMISGVMSTVWVSKNISSAFYELSRIS